MKDVDAHVDALIAFYKRLSEATDDQVAGVCTIDYNKALLAKETPPPAVDPDAERAKISAAAKRKQEERAAQLAGASG